MVFCSEGHASKPTVFIHSCFERQFNIVAIVKESRENQVVPVIALRQCSLDQNVTGPLVTAQQAEAPLKSIFRQKRIATWRQQPIT